MGQLSSINLQQLIDTNNTTVFIETGTGTGLSLKDVLKYNFERYFSIEINTEIFNSVKNGYNWPENVTIFNLDSVSGLKQILELIDINTNILFWLDSHFPGADSLLNSYFAHKHNKDINLPLENELRLIKERRTNNKDVIICDDVRIYQDGNFTEGIWPERAMMEAGNLDFAYEIFSDTHNLEISLLGQGYLFITPKQ